MRAWGGVEGEALVERSEVQELIRQLKSADESLRLRAVNVLASETGEDIRLALPTLKDALLNDPNPAVKYLARKALKNHGIDPEELSRGSGETAGPVASADSGGTGVLALQGGVRVAAVQGLDRIAGPAVLERLAEALCDANPAVRAVALRGLVEVAQPNEAAALRQGITVQEAPASVRVECPNGLRAGGKPILTEIELVTPAMRESALAALEGLADPKFSGLVEALVLDRDPRVKARAARLLWKYGELWAADSLNELLSSGEPVEWEAGVESLSELVEAVRVEGRLLHYPLLRTALRKHPQFEQHAKKKA